MTDEQDKAPGIFTKDMEHKPLGGIDFEDAQAKFATWYAEHHLPLNKEHDNTCKSYVEMENLYVKRIAELEQRCERYREALARVHLMLTETSNTIASQSGEGPKYAPWDIAKVTAAALSAKGE